MRTLVLLLALVLAPTALGVTSAPAWVDDVFAFRLEGPIGARWSITIDLEGNFVAGVLPAAPAPPVCASAHGPCATNVDACQTSGIAPECTGITNDALAHRGPFALLGFQGTIAQSPTGGTIRDTMIFPCAGPLTCRPTDRVVYECTFLPGTIHLAAAWGSEGGSCGFTSWNSLQSGHPFHFSGGQSGDFVGLVTHTVN